MRCRNVLLTGLLLNTAFAGSLFAANEPHRKGKFTASFDQRSPLSSFKEMAKRKATDIDQPGDRLDPQQDYDIAELTYEVAVPSDYDRSRPMGLLVWISAGSSGGAPSELLAPLAKNGFLFIGANKTGNSDPLLRRLGAAIDAVANMQKLYNIDNSRIYLSGNSGGGRCASYAAVIFPDVFTGGAFYVIGCNFWDTIGVPGKPGYTYAGFWPNKDSKLIKQARDHYFVFLTGSKDFNQPGTIGAYEAYKKDGFKHCTYIEVPEMSHTTPPSAYFEQGLAFLNSPLKEKGQVALQEGLRKTASKEYRDAMASFERAVAYGIVEAQAQIDAIAAERDAQTAKGLKYLEEKNTAAAHATLQAVVRAYGDDMAAAAKEALAKIENDPTVANDRKATELFLQIRRNYAAAGAAKTAVALETLIADYPDTAAAKEAKATLARMRKK